MESPTNSEAAVNAKYLVVEASSNEVTILYTFAAKPVLSFMLERVGRLLGEEESFLYENLEFDVKICEGLQMYRP